jgi:hypothetical protein
MEITKIEGNTDYITIQCVTFIKTFLQSIGKSFDIPCDQQLLR